MEAITFEQLPKAVTKLFQKLDAIELMLREQNKMDETLSKWVDIHGAAKITSKTPNALRAQVCLGNLKYVKKGNRLYFERDYLEKWISGELDSK